MGEKTDRRFRESNNNWRGGRVIASNGYVLIRVGRNHHLADVRGYAYEHRIVAEQAIGRQLRDGEVVHHVDGNKQNNTPDNLIVVEGNAEHFVHHRKRGIPLRMPGEQNPRVACGCGCRMTFLKYDGNGRPRRYVSGHNPQRSCVASAILSALIVGPLKAGDIAKCSGLSRLQVTRTLQHLRASNRVINMGRLWMALRKTDNKGGINGSAD